MRIVVTGSAGFIASHLPVMGDILPIDLESGDDVRMQATITKIRAFDPHIVYHLAAHHFVPWCEANPIETDRTNVMGTANILEACGDSLDAFVLASSAAVYGYDPDPIPETHALAGRSVYANSKYRAELLLRQFSETRPDVACVAARLFNVVGAGDKWDHVLPEIVKHRENSLHLGNTWPQRDYIHADDAGDALQFLARKAPVGFSEWNVGTGVGTTVAELVTWVAALSGVTIKAMAYAGKVRADDGHLVADPQKLSAFGWSATRTLTDAINDLLAVA